MRILFLVPVLVGAVSTLAFPQSTAPSAAAPANSAASTEGRKVGRVEGVVMHSITNAPLGRATVLLRPMGPAANSAPMVMVEGFNQMLPQDAPSSGATAADGKFVIENVPEGMYMPMASRTNFLTGYSGDRAPLNTIKVTAGGTVKDVVFKLVPQGVISGRVTDAEGEPIQNVMVAPARYVYNNGRSLSAMGMTQTNDLGEYRIANLAPGKYFLVAMQGMRPMAAAAGVREAIPLTFYPNSLDANGASPIVVEPGADIRGMDFRLKRHAAVTISGKISGMPEGQFTAINLVPLDESLGQLGRMAPRFAPAQGNRFVTTGVLPGTYELRADYRGGGKTNEMLFGRLRVEVGNEDVKDLELVMSPGGEVTGSLRVEGDPLPNGYLMRVSLRGVDGMGFAQGQMEKDNTFRISNVAPGKYVVTMMAPPTHFIQSLKIDDREAGEQPIEVRGQSQVKVDAILASGGGQITGTVEGPDGKPAANAFISIHPVEGTSPMRQDREKTAPTDAKGSFTLKGVPPGSYRVFAWDSFGNGAWRDETLRKENETKSATVKLSETGKEAVSLKVIPLPR